MPTKDESTYLIKICPTNMISFVSFANNTSTETGSTAKRSLYSYCASLQ